MSQILITIFRNKSDDAVMIDDYNGLLTKLKSGEEWELKSTSPKTLYSRFSEVIFKDKGVIITKENPDWRNPYAEFWCLELANFDGSHSESIQLLPPREAGEVVGFSPNGYIEALKGLPRIVPVSIDCKLIKFARIEWRNVTEKVPVEGAPGYWETRTVLKKILIDRSASELKRIAKEREKEAIEKAKREAEKLKL